MQTALQSSDDEAVTAIITENPSYDTFNDLAHSFYDLALAKPTQAGAVAKTLSIVYEKMKDDSDLQGLFKRCIFEMLTASFTKGQDPSIQPSNPFLASAMLSGACVHNGLCNSPAQTGMITRGLHVDDQWTYNISAPFYALHIAHACLQLLAGGKKSWFAEQQVGGYQSEIKDALRSLESDEAVQKNPGLKNLLEATRQQVDSGFQDNLSAQAIWDFLF